MTLLLALALVLGQQSPDHVVRNSEVGFQFEVPEGFQVFPPNPSMPNMLHIALRPPKTGESIPRLIAVEQLPTKLPERPSRWDLQRILGPGAVISTTQWNRRDIPWARADESVEGRPVVTFYAVMPLKTKSINIRAAGDPVFEAEIRDGMLKVISSFAGESAPAKPGEQSSLSMVLVATFLMGAASTAIALVAVRWWLAKFKGWKDRENQVGGRSGDASLPPRLPGPPDRAES
jgi:hypothetical protein